jgi:hypothetical protein
MVAESRSIFKAGSGGFIEDLAFAPGLVTEGAGRPGPIAARCLARDQESHRQNEAAPQLYGRTAGEGELVSSLTRHDRMVPKGDPGVKAGQTDETQVGAGLNFSFSSFPWCTRLPLRRTFN